VATFVRRTSLSTLGAKSLIKLLPLSIEDAGAGCDVRPEHRRSSDREDKRNCARLLPRSRPCEMREHGHKPEVHELA